MSAGTSLRCKDQFLCPICLDVFTEPVSSPCGHNFCNNCITHHWNVSVIFKCPLCKERFNTRPQLRVNTFIREMVSDFRREEQQSSSWTKHQAAKPGDVPCDVCTGTRLKALKSCLVCLASYCENHLEPHLTSSRLKRHQLMEPVENLDERMCRQHERPLELFCRTDCVCVCSLCSALDHKGHEFISLQEECGRKKAILGKTQTGVQQMIQSRLLKVQEINESVKISKDAADRETAEGVQVFTALRTFAEMSLKKLIKETEDKQKTVEKRGGDLIRELRREICELKKRSSEIEQLSCSDDHLHLIQKFSSLKDAPPTKNWTQVRVHPPSYEGTAVRAVARAVEHLEKKLKETTKRLLEAELRRVRQYAADVTLDPSTANPWLVVPDDGKQVYCGNVEKNLPDHPRRFSKCACVLGKQSFSSGRFYFEVEVKGKTEWDLGVARESVNRKGDVTLRPRFGFWTVRLRNAYEYKALAAAPVPLSLWPVPEKVGVFVDYEEGLVSFYDVEAPGLVYSFTGCSFTGKLYPFFFAGLNDGDTSSAPMTICPVK